MSVIDEKPDGMTIALGQRSTDVPELFAEILREHIARRPNLQTSAGPNSPGYSRAPSPTTTCIRTQ
jgi:hypothetical protein